jgi:integrase
MSRTVRDAKLDTREARNRLPVRPRPHWRTLRPKELHIGYVRRRKGQPGYWTVRIYRGPQAAGSPYRVERLTGVADDFQDADGVRTLSFAQAQDAALKKKFRGARGPLTVRSAIEDYIRYLRAEKRSGADAETTAEALILPQLGNLLVADLTTAQLTKWRDDLALAPARLRGTFRRAAKTDDAKRARRATVNRVMTTLKAALNRAFKQGLTDDDLAWRRLERYGEVDARRPGHLSVEEAQRLINAADEDSGFRDLVSAALQTGMRYGELGALRVGDFAHGKVAVHRSKSGKARHVTLTEEGVALFERLTIGRKGDAVMLRNFGRVNELWMKGDQDGHMKRACRAASISPIIGFHQLRHTWASLSVMSLMPMQLVALNMGHVDTRMVEKHYGHLAQSYIDDKIREHAPRFHSEAPTKVTPLRVHVKKR